MTIDEKYNFLKDLAYNENKVKLTQDDQEKLIQLSMDNDSSVRSGVARAVVHYPNAINKGILLTLIEDKDELVRTEAADSLCTYSGIDVYQILTEKSVYDKYQLVRGYALGSLVDVGLRSDIPPQEMLDFYHSRLKKERSLFCRLSILKVLYRLGEHQYLKEIFRFLSYKPYRLRIAAANTLSEIVNESNYAEIEQAVLPALQIEKLRSVSGAMKNLLKRKEDIFPPTE